MYGGIYICPSISQIESYESAKFHVCDYNRKIIISTVGKNTQAYRHITDIWNFCEELDRGIKHVFNFTQVHVNYTEFSLSYLWFPWC
jgi:hypothetical protein